ncbi:MAG: neutral/alkaline non-lysosomal ceramidase N-terminal domain-containing protein [bacterium]
MSLYAGACIRDVSPQSPMFLVGYPHVPRISTGIHDPLLASAICLRNDASAVLLMAIDMLFIGTAFARKVRKEISIQTGLPESHIFISCTHTHSGPVMVDILSWRDDPCVPPVDEKYLAFLQDGIVAAAVEAAKTPHKATLAWTTADASGVGSNRLSVDGVTDSEVGILAVQKVNGDLLAISTIYGMHPTVLHEDSTLVSGDFPAYTRQHLREKYGDDIVVVYHNAPCGNQSPRYAVKAQTFEEAERLGRMLGERVSDAINGLKEEDFSADVIVSGMMDSIETIPRIIPTVADAEEMLKNRNDEFERLKAENAGHVLVRTAECAIFGAEETVVLAHAQETGELSRIHDDYRQADVQAIQIGNLTLVGWPCELFTEYAFELKTRCAGNVYAVSLVNGELQGYIVTKQAMKEGGYEAANSLFTPATGEMLVNAGVKLVEKLREAVI